MAKKKADVRGGAKKIVDRAEDTGKVLFQMRMDSGLHAALAEAAETAGISLNQLIHGICSGCMGKLVQGEREFGPDGRVDSVDVKGCVFFGRVAESLSSDELQRYMDEHPGSDGSEVDKGEFWFQLDFTDRGNVRYR